MKLKPATLLKLTLFHWCFSRFLNCTNGTKSRNTSHIISTENINLTLGNTVEKLKLLFTKRSWGFMNALGKFVREAYKK